MMDTQLTKRVSVLLSVSDCLSADLTDVRLYCTTPTTITVDAADGADAMLAVTADAAVAATAA